MDPHELARRLRVAVATAVVGHDAALDLLLVALCCGGHALLEDVPGVGKTLLARSLAGALGCSFRRVQLTPDVLPSDVTGSNIYNQKTGEFEFRAGPVFTQILLADEINRATPRTQSALLEAMEEHQVTVDGDTRTLSSPFFVLATQNPIELEGTFPLPEAQLDRFLVRVRLGYPSRAQEAAVLERYEATDRVVPEAVTEPGELAAWQAARAAVHVAPAVRGYVLDLVAATRADPRLELGASPRAALMLHRAAQARALLEGRSFVVPDDVKALANPVLAHRLIVSPATRLSGEDADSVLAALLAEVPVPVEALEDAASSPSP